MDNGWWIVCGVLAIVILVNVGLMVSALRYRRSNPEPIFGKGFSELLTPWKDEAQALKDLHEDVQALKENRDE